MTANSNETDVSTDWIDIDVADGSRMPCYVVRPSGAPTAGLMVLQEAFGVNEHIQDVTRRFARAGYVAVAPTLFHRTDARFEGSYTDFSGVMPHISAVTDDGLAADITAVFDWLSSPSGGNTPFVGSVGYCMGGRASYLADAVVPVKAAVSYYGGGIAPSPMRGGDLLGRAAELHAPILLFWGGLDQHIGPEQRSAVESALIAADRDYVNVVFSKADHGFHCDARASYHPVASRHAEALTLEFLKTYLSPA
jgi:carboxymethylenebutenolidase